MMPALSWSARPPIATIDIGLTPWGLLPEFALIRKRPFLPAGGASDMCRKRACKSSGKAQTNTAMTLSSDPAKILTAMSS